MFAQRKHKDMKKLLLTLIPASATLLYVVGQFVVYSITGHMYFSPTFMPELVVYVLFGFAYIFIAIHIDRPKYLWLAILGLALGIILFVTIGMKLFFSFEFFRNLSI